MANWGLLMGVGQGIQQVGGMLETRGKQQLADKLSLEKEGRDAARADKLRQQELLEPDVAHTSFEQRDGAWYQVTPNKSGRDYDSRLAPQSKIDELNMEREKDRVSIDSLITTSALNKKKLDSYDTEQGLENRYKEAQIDLAGDRGLAATMTAQARVDKADAPGKLQPQPTAGSMANTLVKEYDKEIEQYGIDPSVARDLAQKVSANLIRDAKEGNVKDPRQVYLDALRRITKLPSAGKETL